MRPIINRNTFRESDELAGDLGRLSIDSHGRTIKCVKVGKNGKCSAWSTIPPPARSFRQNIAGGGGSSNIEDRRGKIQGMHAFQLFGYLTWKTWYHLQISVKPGIKNALQSYGFYVEGINIYRRDVQNSQYNFGVFLQVRDGYATQAVVNSFNSVLNRTVALPNSVRITRVLDYSRGNYEDL